MKPEPNRANCSVPTCVPSPHKGGRWKHTSFSTVGACGCKHSANRPVERVSGHDFTEDLSAVSHTKPCWSTELRWHGEAHFKAVSDLHLLTDGRPGLDCASPRRPSLRSGSRRVSAVHSVPSARRARSWKDEWVEMAVAVDMRRPHSHPGESDRDRAPGGCGAPTADVRRQIPGAGPEPVEMIVDGGLVDPRAGGALDPLPAACREGSVALLVCQLPCPVCGDRHVLLPSGRIPPGGIPTPRIIARTRRFSSTCWMRSRHRDAPHWILPRRPPLNPVVRAREPFSLSPGDHLHRSRIHPQPRRTTMIRPKYDDPRHGQSATDTAAAQSRSGWRHALAMSCERHHAPAGVPCWSWAGDTYDHSGLCDRRCREAGLVPPAHRGGGRTPSAGASADLGRRQVAARHPNR